MLGLSGVTMSTPKLNMYAKKSSIVNISRAHARQGLFISCQIHLWGPCASVPCPCAVQAKFPQGHAQFREGNCRSVGCSSSSSSSEAGGDRPVMDSTRQGLDRQRSASWQERALLSAAACMMMAGGSIPGISHAAEVDSAAASVDAIVSSISPADVDSAASVVAPTVKALLPYVPSPYEPGWEIWVGAAAVLVPFALGAYEFSKRFVKLQFIQNLIQTLKR